MLTEEQRKAIEWASEHAANYARPIEGETTMMRHSRVLREMLAAHNAGAQAEPFDAMQHQTLLGYNANGEAIFGTDPKALAAAHPQPMPQTDAARDVQDVKRYRLLRERHFVRADNPNAIAYHCVGIFTSWLPAPTIDREGLDAVLDAEIERLDRAKGD